MKFRRLCSTTFGLVVLSVLVVPVNAQLSEQAARQQASNIARSELHSTVHFRPDQFLGIQRDEELEQKLGVAVGGQAGLTFIYKVSPEGVELRENAVVYHTWTDVDPLFIVVVNPRDASAYRIHGFGRGESLTEFDRLMTELKVQVTSPDQAESVADLYREVNPENHERLTPILRLIELKQAAERQCQSGAKSFERRRKSVYSLVEACGAAVRRAFVPAKGCPSRQRLSRGVDRLIISFR